MSLVSVNFLAFIALLFILYFIAPPKFQWIILLVFSYVFYAMLDARAFVVVLTTTVSIYGCAMLIDRRHTEQKNALKDQSKEWLAQNKKSVIATYTKKRRTLLIIALLLNFGILAYVKYLGFALENINKLIALFAPSFAIPYRSVLLPVGISFYTFQATGYVMDVYRGKYQAEKNLGKFALFVSFFPQIIQGPISQYDQLAPQLYAPHTFEYTRFKHGMELILWGFFKKLLIADRASVIVKEILPNYAAYDGFGVSFAMLLFVLQVYTDFSGGIDVTRGAAQCLGIDMVENFRRPLFADTVSEYWQRWHITLGAWMKEYLLYSITFSKGFGRFNKLFKKKFTSSYARIIPTCLATSVVFFTVGIWHGASINNIMFGVYNGALIIGGIFLEIPRKKLITAHPWLGEKNPFWHALRVMRTFLLIYIGKFFAATPSFSTSIALLKASAAIFTKKINPLAFLGGIDLASLVIITYGCAALLIVSLLGERGVRVREALDRKNIVVRWAVYYLILFSVLSLSSNGSGVEEFLYAQF